MKNLAFTVMAASLMLCSCTEKTEWNYLLDENLSKWEIYQSFEFDSPEYHGNPLDEEGNPVAPIGFNKNVKGLFTVDIVDGEPVLHGNGKTYGCVFTKESFSNYILCLKVKFGEDKYHPRKDKALDSGLLYHSQGDPGVDYWLSWKRSHEFQLMEGGTDEGNYGDWWPVSSVRCSVKTSVQNAEYWYDPAGEKHSFGAGAECGDHIRVIDYGSAHGEWTDIMLVCFGNKSVYVVNGQVAMALEDLAYVQNGNVMPLDHGQIQLQSEGGEVYFKDVKIRPIDCLPAKYSVLFD